MTAETTGTDPAPAPWRAAQQEATNATWHVSAISNTAPFCVAQTMRDDTYAGELHYATADPVHAIAAEYGVPVTETPSGTTDTCVSARVTVGDIEIRAWAIVYGTRTPGGTG